MNASGARRLLVVLGTVLALAAGAAIWHNLPENTDIYAPFDVAAGVGQRAEGRDLSATVESVSVASALGTDAGPEKAAGVWVVVETTADAGPEYALAHAELVVGDSSYAPTDRIIVMPPVLVPGIVERRGWAFDVAPERLAAVDTVRFRMWVGDGRLDSRLVFTIPMNGDDVRHVDTLPIKRPTQKAA